MGIAIDVAGAEDEASSELERVLAHSMLAMAGGPRSLASGRVVTTQEMEKGSSPETGGAIGYSPLVDQEREGDACLLAEESGVVPIT